MNDAECNEYKNIILKTMDALGMRKDIRLADELPIVASELMRDYTDSFSMEERPK